MGRLDVGGRIALGRFDAGGRLAALLLVVAAMSGCAEDSLLEPKPAVRRLRSYTFDENAGRKLDVLFVVDNSSDSGPQVLQTELIGRFAKFVKPFSDLAEQGLYADLHVGVVSTDYGAGTGNAPGCPAAGDGEAGKLIAVGAGAAKACRPPKGARYIEYRFDAGAAVHNLPEGVSLPDQFACMAALGESGCPFEHPLESARAALAGDLVENQGFLREDARLMVVFVTSEDDASAPRDTDVFDPGLVARYGFASSYPRQTRFGVLCGDPLGFPPYSATPGPLEGCRPAPNPDGRSGPGKLFDVSRYADFFGLPRVQGGLKQSPLDVVLVGIDGPEAPFQVMLSNPRTPPGQPYAACNALDESANPPCVPVLRHSCDNPRNARFFGDPAVRLNAVIRAVPGNLVGSVCDDDFGPLLDRAGWLAAARFGQHCLTAPLSRDAAGGLAPECTVNQVTAVERGVTTVPLPRCDDPANPARPPCWVIEAKGSCGSLSPDGVGLTVRRGVVDGVPVPPPPHTTLLVSCVLRGE